ncbi:DUF502 domain-containing protein [Algoriphagus sp.]|uniref:DUF502 domain-containing protein n=1 Tax=Algoriphagus sp. TaxID=1872435 RepID=UPI00271866B3|nr:DUF502 domain-containing protein [Algoriphagus sp.]MDO8967613.1 DUF502 domain-containing protein [Algoriphagus sp.]MDP3198586.1 DUF502 domain-containing protein [Algoriphagus sp.]
MENSTHPNPNKNIPLDKFWSKPFFIKTLLDGLLLVLPTIIILFLLSLIFKFVFNIVSPISALLDKNAEKHALLINLLALLILVVFIFTIGLILRSARSKKSFKIFEGRYLLRIPLYSTLQETIAQFSGLKKMPFSQVVLIDAYNTEVLLTGFITEKACDGIYTVFVPTAPNPMNGNIYHVPSTQMRFLDIEPEKAMRTIMGMGTGSSVLFAAREKTEEVEELDEVKRFPIVNDTNPENDE